MGDHGGLSDRGGRGRRRLAGPAVPAMGYALPLEEEFMTSTEEMVEAMRELAKF